MPATVPVKSKDQLATAYGYLINELGLETLFHPCRFNFLRALLISCGSQAYARCDQEDGISSSG
eukprot:1149148-Amorphochlora_amoeboformis.AAC.2